MVVIGIPGEFDPAFTPHVATNAAIAHAAEAIGIDAAIEWVPTDTFETDAANRIARFDGIWAPPGSPYKSLLGAIRAIQEAREQDVPFLGTCGGYQHAVLEYARNVLGFDDAQHAEYGPNASRLFISALACSLAGTRMNVNLVPGTKAQALYDATSTAEAYYCNFGLNPDERPGLEAAGLIVSGVDDDGEARILEIAANRFYMATLFVPQTSSTPGHPHPIVRGFVEAANAFAAERPVEVMH